MTERGEATEKKHEYLRDFCKLVIMKECEFCPSVSQPYKQKLPGDYLLKQICAGQYFGAVVCNIRVSEPLKEYFAGMPPIFKNVDVSIEDIGEYRINVCQNLCEFKTP